MCELFGVNAPRKIEINDLLDTFFSHSVEHRNGWGLAILDDTPATIDKEPVRAVDSAFLKQKLTGSIVTANCIAHIRKATIGDVDLTNTHPFSGFDASGRQWVLAHNGTIFDSPALAPYQYTQMGSTDSERILLYLIDRINRLYEESQMLPDEAARIRVVEDVILEITPGNKVNLLISDGDCFYVHKNEAGTMFQKEAQCGVLFSTQPLQMLGWKEVSQNQLLVYRNGVLIYAGQQHNNTYIHDEREMKLLYYAYSGL